MKQAEIAMPHLILLVVGVVTLVGLTSLFVSTKANAGMFVNHEACKLENLQKVRMALQGDGAVLPSEGKHCKTDVLSVKKGNEHKTMADSLAYCWDRYLRGEHAAVFEGEDGVYCAICSVLEFEDKQTIFGFNTYLMDQKAPLDGKPYLDFFTGITVTDEVRDTYKNTALEELDKIDTNQKYASVFVMDKNVAPGSLTGQTSLQSGITGATIGGGITTAASVVALGLCGLSGVCLAGIAMLSIPAIGLGVGQGFYTGYLMGSDLDPNYDARVLLAPYNTDQLREMGCTVLEGDVR